jgi:DivIVA domain-containing protein
MPLTPADVHNVAFSKPPIGKRGYNEDEVDAFLDLVEGELARLVEENNDLHQRVQELDAQTSDSRSSTSSGGASAPTPVPVAAPVLEKTPEPAPVVAPAAVEAPAAPVAEAPDHNVRAAKVLALAQEMADRLTGEAQSESDTLTSTAKASSEKRPPRSPSRCSPTPGPSPRP